ncbi:hypothetical protein NDU88_002429 [Pleurodeles waltl]|uniref:Uncharacterized protein n=1 Tax=Pleurodeles waltl TaxID=8319 RepID=A0AAV7UXN8_PLEWA|nr:hypothetical protein NDU88_002429 [Pleurodeles waltl]
MPQGCGATIASDRLAPGVYWVTRAACWSQACQTAVHVQLGRHVHVPSFNRQRARPSDLIRMVALASLQASCNEGGSCECGWVPAVLLCTLGLYGLWKLYMARAPYLSIKRPSQSSRQVGYVTRRRQCYVCVLSHV